MVKFVFTAFVLTAIVASTVLFVEADMNIPYPSADRPEQVKPEDMKPPSEVKPPAEVKPNYPTDDYKPPSEVNPPAEINPNPDAIPPVPGNTFHRRN